MRRSLCWMGIVALCLCGCGKKERPREPTAVQTPQAPTSPAESNTPTEPEKPEHPVVAALHDFLRSINKGNYDRALALAIPGEFTRQSLDGLHQAFQWDQVTFAQVWVGAEQAAVITNPVPVTQGSGTFTWAFNLVATEDGHWLVRLSDPLGAAENVPDYVAAFREVAADAKAIEL